MVNFEAPIQEQINFKIEASVDDYFLSPSTEHTTHTTFVIQTSFWCQRSSPESDVQWHF
jgi:hypothetical protein